MEFIEQIKKRAKNQKKKIVLPEYMDRRVLQAAEIALREEIADIIIIATNEEIKANSYDLDLSKATIIDPKNYEDLENLINYFVEIRKNKNLSYEEAKNLLLTDYMYFACMLVKTGRADGIVSGACHSSANTLRPALQIIKASPNIRLVSAFFLMVVPNCPFGENGIFIFADSGLCQNPNSLELAQIAASSADSFQFIVEKKPLVAMLSHSTKGSAKHEDVSKVLEATKLAKENYPQYTIDGELQLDAAIIPEIAKFKAPNSEVAGRANVLIFPDLDAGNIGYKLVERLAKAKAYGPITQGIAHPVNDLSRGCSVEDIVGVIAITAVQAQKKLI